MIKFNKTIQNNNLNSYQQTLCDFMYNKKIYYIHNSYGLGDNVFNLILFSIINNFIVENNIIIFYYTKNKYIEQLKEFVITNNIKLLSLENKPYFSIELWVNNTFFNYTHINAVSKSKNYLNLNHYYTNFFNIVFNKFKFNIRINNLIYFDDNLISIYDTIPNKYKNFDILILNSQPLSGQYNYNKLIWDKYIINLNNHFKILTTTKVKELLSTSDDNLTIKSIASLSTKAKIVIAVNSGVIPGLFNIFTLENVKQFFIFDSRSYYSYPKFQNKNCITDITFEELKKYLY